MKRRKIFWKILKGLQIDKIMAGYVSVFFMIGFGICLLEPTIEGYLDSLWYCFGVATTIGFGDLLATNILSRILTVILSLYSTLIVALIPAVLINYFIEYMEMRKSESAIVIIDKLENLDKLSREELVELSKKIKTITKK